jgi:hypothetical protein
MTAIRWLPSDKRWSAGFSVSSAGRSCDRTGVERAPARWRQCAWDLAFQHDPPALNGGISQRYHQQQRLGVAVAWCDPTSAYSGLTAGRSTIPLSKAFTLCARARVTASKYPQPLWVGGIMRVSHAWPLLDGRRQSAMYGQRRGRLRGQLPPAKAGFSAVGSAPIPDLPSLAPARGGSTQKGFVNTLDSLPYCDNRFIAAPLTFIAWPRSRP